MPPSAPSAPRLGVFLAETSSSCQVHSPIAKSCMTLISNGDGRPSAGQRTALNIKGLSGYTKQLTGHQSRAVLHDKDLNIQYSKF